MNEMCVVAEEGNHPSPFLAFYFPAVEHVSDLRSRFCLQKEEVSSPEAPLRCQLGTSILQAIQKDADDNIDRVLELLETVGIH